MCNKAGAKFHTAIGIILLAAAFFVMLLSYEADFIKDAVRPVTSVAVFAFFLIYACLPVFVKALRARPERLFLYYFLIASLLALIFIPYGFVPDEENHFLRIISLSQFNIFSGTANVPVNISDILRPTGAEAFAKVWNLSASELTQNIQCTSAIYYPPLSYLPQVLGVLIAGIFTDKYYIILIFARAFALGTTAFIIYKSIKIAPFGKYIIIAAAMLPLFIQEAASASCEGPVNALVIANLSYYFYLKKRGRLLTRRQIAVMAVLIIATFSVKPIYCLFGFTYLFLDKELFKPGKKFIYTGLICIIGLLLPISYMAVLRFSGFDFSASAAEGASMLAQGSSVLQNPLNFFSALGNSLITMAGEYVSSFFSLLLISFQISKKAIILFVCILIYTALCDHHEKIGGKSFIAILSALILTFIIIFLMEYLQWTEVGENVIYGVQGRYFIPLLVPFLSLFKRPHAITFAGPSYESDKSLAPAIALSAFSMLSVYELTSAVFSLMFF